MTPWNLIEVTSVSMDLTAYILLACYPFDSFISPEHGSDMFVQNVNIIPNYTASLPRDKYLS
jgi:hypothetical protein